jgi:hypothetical protein
MPQYQDFGFQSPSRLEAIAQRADEKEADCNHAAIISDSPVTASQMDWVFGSDTIRFPPRPASRPRCGRDVSGAFLQVADLALADFIVRHYGIRLS